ncbi:GNAT family protein [Streptomyces sp. JV185]|uniref:GNAT family N-acetyltransferase n=1 Tax=Streptomyces sp. JV185 TaxID=858638 RepID=UPI002E776F0F|nr:GNAT family protein [Streptomyces sp. JV185]MEE1768343.1 GNAT family protein [Streptomyces sp. JV185]
MSTVTPAMFTCPLGHDAALIPRTVAIAEAHQALLMANYERLAQWDPDFDAENPTTLDETRSRLERQGHAWLEGTQLPLDIAVPAGRDWQLVGAVTLNCDMAMKAGEIGYWIDAAFEGRGLVTRAATAVLDQALGRIGLDRVELRTGTDNARSRSVARRLGFTEEGLLREAVIFPNGSRDDDVVYGLLAREWLKSREQDGPSQS